MRLEAEKRTPTDNVKEKKIRATLSALRSYGPSSFASLTDESGSYLQVAGGGPHCLLEHYNAPEDKFYRAYLDTKHKVFADGTVLAFGGGELKLLSDEWISIAVVIDAFLAFLHHSGLPAGIKWRDVTKNFR